MTLDATPLRVLGHAQRSRPVDAIEEVSLTIQLIGTSQHVHKVAQRVHDGKGQQEDRRTHGAVAVVVQLEVACAEWLFSNVVTKDRLKSHCWPQNHTTNISNLAM